LKKNWPKSVYFSLCHVDLDNFKPFVDHYGYAWGSEVIKDLGYIITQQVKSLELQDVLSAISVETIFIVIPIQDR